MNNVLMVAYHYPPEGSSSGVQRTLKFSQYLGEHGWNPVVLTAHPCSYRVRRDDQIGEIPPGMVVCRSFALDSARHLSIRGRYLDLTALPDPWVSWLLPGVISGLRLTLRYRPRVIWSTFPIATAHLIGLALRRLTGLPWIADFRDMMFEGDYPADERRRGSLRWIEARTVERSARVVLTTPGAVRVFAHRYATLEPSRFTLIPNGYDEENFEEAERLGSPYAEEGTSTNPIVLVHSGALYPSERDPRCFYEAISRLLRAGQVSPSSFRVVLRATGHDEHHLKLLRQHGIESVVTLAPSLPYREALREMMDAHGLLLLQASNCNNQIPAKIYEYLRARRPIFAMTDPHGDTAKFLDESDSGTVVPLDDTDRIQAALVAFLASIRSGNARVPSDDLVARHSRRARAAALARVLDESMENGPEIEGAKLTGS